MTKVGREVKSEFVLKAVGAEELDRFKEDVFPKGGIDFKEGDAAVPWRRYYFESY